MICKTREELPEEYGCLLCNATKPMDEMILIRRKKTSDFVLRPRCKACHNKKERGSRREWKRNYQRRWRKYNPEVNDSYWRNPPSEERKRRTACAYERFQRSHNEILIQGRLRRRGHKVSIEEARELLRKYGPCYPTRFGLTPAGLRECERIRSRMRAAKTKFTMLEIRMMVYEDSSEQKFVIKRSRQVPPYRSAAKNLKRYWAKKRQQEAA